MNTTDRVSRSLDSFNAVSRMPADNRKDFNSVEYLGVMNNDHRDTTAQNMVQNERLDVREDDMCGIINRLTFANFHDVSVKCDIDMTEETEKHSDLPRISQNENDNDPIGRSILAPGVEILTDSLVFPPRSEIKSEPDLENPTFLSESIDLFKSSRARPVYECHSWRGLFRHPKLLLPMSDKMKLHRDERLRRKREAERLRYNRIGMDPQLASSQVVKEKAKYSRKKREKQIKLVRDMTYFEHQMMKLQWRSNSSAYYKRKKRKPSGIMSYVEKVKKYEKLESCIERLKNRNIRLL